MIVFWYIIRQFLNFLNKLMPYEVTLSLFLYIISALAFIYLRLMRTCTNPIEDYYIIVLECEEITIYFVEEILELVSKIDINLSTIITYHILPYFYSSCIKSYRIFV